MRYYDVKSGRRFDMNHNLWPVKNDGEKYKVLTAKQKSFLEQSGQIRLVPSVTEVLAFLSNAGLINWAMKFGAECGFKYGSENPFNTVEEAVAFAETERYAPAEAGSNIHAEIEDINSTTYKHVHEVMLTYGIDIAGGEHEVQFCLDGYGGTIDLIGENCLIDWKTTKKARDPYKTECCQLVAYNAWAKKERLINVYIDQETKQVYKVKEWSDQQKQSAQKIFDLCVKLFEETKGWDE